MVDVIVVEDNPLAQQRLGALIKPDNALNILATYYNLATARNEKRDLKPQLIVLDLKLPDVRGTEAIEALKKKYPDARLTIYTAYEHEIEILQCMAAGANGYILKDTPDERLPAELSVIANGGSTLTPRVAEKIMRHLLPAKPADSPLSERELQVLNYISLGLKYEDIAVELGISVHTVRHHIEKIYKKLDVTSRGQAVAQAVRAGIIKME
ncbi:MAG: response regulator transcription factor [Spirochaetes bacterium]|nr:response regulator transcription factor [Spirochaetota bacterium]